MARSSRSSARSASPPRKPVVLKLADQANTFVMNHMTTLESTGLVRYQKLPPAAMPAVQDTSQLAISGNLSSVNPAIIWTVLLAAVTVNRLFRRPAF
jgi:hypothetical protein